MPSQDYKLDAAIAKAGRVHKLVGVDRATFLDINQIAVQLNLSYGESVKFLTLFSALDFKSDIRKDTRVQLTMKRMGKILPQ